MVFFTDTRSVYFMVQTIANYLGQLPTKIHLMQWACSILHENIL